jgi:hypothetical protein
VAGEANGLALSYHPLQVSDSELAWMLDTVRATGARWIRFDFYWSAVQTTQTSWNWGSIDRVVNAARARGLSVLPTLAYTPAWARPGGTTDHAPPTNPEDFASFARAAVQRYSSQGIKVWEIWNEPNNGGFWEPKPSAGAYVALLGAAHAAIHAADPTATVLLGGLSPAGGTLDWVSSDGRYVSPWRFLRDVYDAGGAGKFDAVAFHPYAGQPWMPSQEAEWNPFQQTEALRDLMVQRGDGAKQIWGTEAGAWTGGDRAIPESEQAAHVREYLLLWDQWSWTGPFFYYELKDKGSNTSDREQTFGLFRSNGTAKPGFDAYRDTVAG